MIERGIFKANDIRGITEGPDPEWDAAGSFAIGAAAVEVLDLTKDPGALVVGRDMRTSGPKIAAAFIDGVLSRGVNVIDIGLASTDQLWFASGSLDLPGAMFTASHNPSEYNGIKFCLAGAKPITPGALAEIGERALAAESLPAVPRGQRSEHDTLPAYANYLHSLVDLTDIRPLRVVADAGNGMAGFTLPAVLGGNDLELIGLFLDLDGTFPNHPPNPLEP
jgi:phosphomannomutase